jgi:hypothetical protein
MSSFLCPDRTYTVEQTHSREADSNSAGQEIAAFRITSRVFFPLYFVFDINTVYSSFDSSRSRKRGFGCF